MKFVALCLCAVICIANGENYIARLRRQTGLNGAHTDAMDVSRNGGIGGSNNPMLTPGDGARLGVGYGGKVSDNVGLGAAARADFSTGGGPFVRAPEVGVGATYSQGSNSYSLGVGRSFGPAPSNQVGFTFKHQFKRAADYYRRRRDDSPALNAAVANALTNKPVGTPQLSYQVGAAGNSARDFGAAGSVGAGMKVFESGSQSVGVGLGASGSMARVDGTTYTGHPQIGAGVGYQNGAFSASIGAARETSGPSRGNFFGAGMKYDFKRSAVYTDDIDELNHTKEQLDELNHTKEQLDIEKRDIGFEDNELNHTKEQLDELNHTKEQFY